MEEILENKLGLVDYGILGVEEHPFSSSTSLEEEYSSTDGLRERFSIDYIRWDVRRNTGMSLTEWLKQPLHVINTQRKASDVSIELDKKLEEKLRKEKEDRDGI